MIDEKLLIDEIDRRIKAIEKIKLNDIAGRDELIYIKGFIDSMPKEPVNHNKLNIMLDEALSKETSKTWNERLDKESVSNELEEAASSFARKDSEGISNPANFYYTVADKARIFKAGAKWQKENLWKPADGDDLPEIDREVIALLDNGKVVYAHRPYKGKYLGKNLITGNIETFENQTYDKGGWNLPDVKYWLDVSLPKEIEL